MVIQVHAVNLIEIRLGERWQPTHARGHIRSSTLAGLTHLFFVESIKVLFLPLI